MADEDDLKLSDEELAFLRFQALPRRLRLLLLTLKEEQIDTLEYLMTLKRAELQSGMKFRRDATAVGRFLYWFAVVTVGCFVGAAALGDSAMKIFHWFKGS